MFDLGIIRWAAGKALHLPPRIHRQVEAERDIAIPMRDGTILLADRYFPAGQKSGPAVLIRSPYGSSPIFGVVAGLFAERGVQIVLQRVRGTGGSGGQFNPMRQELSDGTDTVDWVRAQTWFSEKLFAFGASYMGMTQWAMAHGRPEGLDGLVLLVTLSNFRDEMHAFGGFTLGTMLAWTKMMADMTDTGPGKKMARPDPNVLKRVGNHLPLGTIDQAAIGKAAPWWQDWVSREDPDDPWWQDMDHSKAVSALDAPTVMIGGWRDIFLPFQIRDYEARQAAGKQAWLTIGPWSHVTPGGMVEGLRQAIMTFADMAAGRKPHADRDRVRVYLQGAGEWREYPSWPPPQSTPARFYLDADGRLESVLPADNGATTYVYDPADPTPAVHGPQLMGGAKRRHMSELEQRSDTILFTSAPMVRDCDVIGPVNVELSVRSDREHTDFYACLCDVDAKGRSLQVSDGYLRLKPGSPDADASGIRRITITCWPTAYRFRRGHKLRLIIASGAHPRYARNLGTGEPLVTATRMVPARQEVFHGVDHCSSLSLRIVS